MTVSAFHKPKISVVTPSFNQGRFLPQAIESVISQGYENLEYIVIDGASDDDSVSVIRRYADHVDYWVSEPDSGQSDGINKGLRRATGDLVAWLNADDYYLPGTFQAVVDQYQKSPGRPFYFGDGLRVSADRSPISRFFPDTFSGFNRAALVMGLNYILQPSTFMSRNALVEIGYLDETLHYGMDTDLWLRLSALGEPVRVDGVLSASREYADTKTASGSFERVEELRRIALKHSGKEITPGVICYLLDTLHRYAKQNQDVFPPAYLTDMSRFWRETSSLMSSFGAGPDGFPLDHSAGSVVRNGSIRLWRRIRRIYNKIESFRK